MYCARLKRQNKPGSFVCASRAFPKPAICYPFEFCENGAKASLWEMTRARRTPQFWEDHTVTTIGTSDTPLSSAGTK